jgi:methionine-S-sulfoxide reductase
MMVVMLSFVAAALAASLFMATSGGDEKAPAPAPGPAPASGAGDTLVVAGGCFWCLEPLFEMVKGVTAVEVGYAGGHVPNPTYEMVTSGTTGHAEAVKITFDPNKISADDLLLIFFTMHDPTTLNRQGGDVGTQYRSALFYTTDAERERAEKAIARIESEKIWPKPLVTRVEKLLNYTRAEEYHQDYYRKFEKAGTIERMRMNAGYCSAVIEPKVKKFRDRFADKLRS